MIIVKAVKSILWVICVQMMAGCIAIYVIDKIMAFCGVGIYVGINTFTVLFSGVFGLPGVCALFAVAGILGMVYF